MASKITNTQNCGWLGCHTSTTAQLSGGVVPTAPVPLDLSGDAAEGINCDFCHKIGDVYLDPKTKLPPPDMPGILSYRLYRPAEGQQLFFGTFDDVPRRDTYLPLQKESAFCAPCHYGVFGGVVGPGHVEGGTLIYNSYGEWLASPYSDPKTGKTCQECHMPAGHYNYYVLPEMGGTFRPSDALRVHRMPGASDVNLLQNAVTMTTTAGLKGGQLTVDISITNDKTGHHVPTDVPLREMILTVQAHDAQGRLLSLQGGPTLPGWTGNFAGQAGKAFAKILQDEWSGEVPTAAYWRPTKVVADTRLPALATDSSRYTYALPAGAGPVKIEARLVFRRAPMQLMEQKGWTDPDIVMAHDTLLFDSAAQQGAATTPTR
jgi:hypothetical protein